MGIDYDTFTGTNGVLLTAHTSDAGNTWAKVTHADTGTTSQIQGNVLVQEAGSPACSCYTSAVPPAADYTVQADFYSTAYGSDYIGLWARLTDASALNGYMRSEE